MIEIGFKSITVQINSTRKWRKFLSHLFILNYCTPKQFGVYYTYNSFKSENGILVVIAYVL